MFDITYLKLLSKVLLEGEIRKDRTGVGTIGIFGTQSKYDISEKFPLLTTKKIHTKSVIHELVWFLSGDTNIQYLKNNGVKIWDEWADENGDLGPVYGQQWRNFQGVDQITRLITDLKNNPFSRRHIVSAWNPVDVPTMALPPCHTLFQFYVRNGKDSKILDCQLYQRSADLFLGVPFNIASYSLLTYMIAHCLEYKPGIFTHTIGDAHIYLNHVEQVTEQIKRKPFDYPTLKINTPEKNIFNITYDDIIIENYVSHPAIKAPIAI